MKTILLTFGMLFLILIFNKIYFFYKKNKVVFYDYFIKFIYFTIIILSVMYYFIDRSNLPREYVSSILICYLVGFFAVFFTISLKSYESPTNFIYKFLSKKSDYQKLLLFLKKKNIIIKRFEDLKKQRLIKDRNGKISLTLLGYNFAKTYYFLMNFFKIKNEG